MLCFTPILFSFSNNPLLSFNLGYIFFNFDISIDGLNALDSLSEDEYDKYNFSCAVVKAL